MTKITSIDKDELRACIDNLEEITEVFLNQCVEIKKRPGKTPKYSQKYFCKTKNTGLFQRNLSKSRRGKIPGRQKQQTASRKQ